MVTTSRGKFGRRVRAFANEIAIIVIGVLIALGLGGLAEDWGWQRKASNGQERLRSELRNIFGHAAEQVIVSPCILTQLDDLRDRLTSDDETLGPVPFDTFPDNLAVLRLPTRPWSGAIWDALQQDGTASHFTPAQQRYLGNTYSVVATMRGLVLQSGDASGRLLVMGHTTRLSPELRATLLITVAEQYRRTQYMNRLAAQLMATMRDLGYRPSDAEVSDLLARTSVGSASIVFCRGRGLPLADWKTEMNKVPHLSRRPI